MRNGRSGTKPYLLLTAKLESNGEDALADIGVQSRPVPGHELAKHVLGGRNDGLVAGQACRLEHHGLELLLHVAVVVGELPSHLVSLGADEIPEEGLKPIPGMLVLEHPGALDASQTADDLVPHDELRLGVEALEQAQDTRRLLVSRRSQCAGVGNHTRPVLDSQEAFLGGLAQLLQTGRGVRGAVDAGVIGVELEEVATGQLEILFTLGEGQGLVDAVLGAHAQEDGVQDFILLGLRIARSQEAVLLHVDTALLLVLRDGKDRVTDLLRPRIHNLLQGLAARGAQRRPQISGLGVSVGMLLQVLSHAFQEDVLAEVRRDHAQDAGSLGVGNGIEDLVDLVGALDGHLDGVAASQGVERKSRLQVVGDVRLPNVPLRVEGIARVLEATRVSMRSAVGIRRREHVPRTPRWRSPR